jgi:hypothetical protein
MEHPVTRDGAPRHTWGRTCACSSFVAVLVVLVILARPCLDAWESANPQE